MIKKEIESKKSGLRVIWLKKPIQCRLWRKEVLTEDDFNMVKYFDLIKKLVDESHWIRQILKCKECGQLYFKELYEKIDWVDGNDPQYRTYIPIEEKDIEEINKSDLFGICMFLPQIRYDLLQNGTKNINWFGRNATKIKQPNHRKMKYTSLIQEAIIFAIQTHEVDEPQKRKGKNIPYITHPLTVGLILARAGASEDVIAAGILHDTIEDSIPEKKVTREMLKERFGEKVASLVQNVTETQKDLPWEDRKKEALEHIESFSNDAVLLKSADVISNISELLDDHIQEGEHVWDRFNASKEMILENTYRVIEALRCRWPESPLSPDLNSVKERLVNIEMRFAQ